MKKTDIPRMELNAFTSVNYSVPLLKVLHYPLNGTYFIIEDRESYPVVDYISPNRRNFFKVFHNGMGCMMDTEYITSPMYAVEYTLLSMKFPIFFIGTLNCTWRSLS